MEIVFTPEKEEEELTLKMTIMRGLPGSGKSTWIADNRPDARYCSADDFFIVNGEYQFDPRKIGEAHESCKQGVLRALADKKDVVIDNTHTQRWEYQTYLMLAELVGCEIEIIEMVCDSKDTLKSFVARQIHGVPTGIILEMWFRWEDESKAVLY